MVGDSWQNPERRANDKLILETCSSEHELPWFNWMMNYSQFMQGIWVRRVRIQWIKKNGKYIKILDSRKALIVNSRMYFWTRSTLIRDDHLLLQQMTDSTKKIHQMLGSTKGTIRIRSASILTQMCLCFCKYKKDQRAISLMKSSQITWSTSLVQW